MDVHNLGKFEWENEVPFSIDVINKTLHAVIGEGEEPRNKDYVMGLLVNNRKWGLNSVYPKHNDVFGTHSFGQVNSSFSITVKATGDNSTSMKIVVSGRQGNFIGGANQAYLQAECEKFIDALTYYLEHQEPIKYWHETYKPQTLQKKAQANNKGCAMSLLLPIVIGAGGLITYLLC